MKNDIIEIKYSKANTVYWLIKAANGKVLTVSEMYDSKRNAVSSAVNFAHRMNMYGTVISIKDKTGDE